MPNGYDPIVGMQPENPTDVLTFSMLQRPHRSPKTGPPTRWPRVSFYIRITSYTFEVWNHDKQKWAAYAKNRKQMPFIVGEGIRRFRGRVAENKQLVIPLEPNSEYRGKFPASILVTYTTRGPGGKDVRHKARATRFD